MKKRRALYASATLGYKNFLFVDGTIRNDWYSTLPVAKNDVLSNRMAHHLYLAI
ncbi:MAG: hypothetical protein IPP48_02660 [Chitinophagaceae bacterium]|nr:hypothetical protein [Chitinophagaceae bacterium]